MTGSEGGFLGEEGRSQKRMREPKVKRKWNKALTKLGVVKTYYCDVNLEMKVPFQKKKNFLKVWDRWKARIVNGFLGDAWVYFPRDKT